MQAIPNPSSVTVFGFGARWVEPEFATVRASVQRVRGEPAPALNEAREAARAVRAVLTKRGIAASDVRAGRLSLVSAMEGYGPQAKFLGYRATIESSITVHALDELDGLLAAIVEAGANVVSEVRFDRADLPLIRAEARRLAIADARDKAEVLARAAAIQLGPIRHIEDSNPALLASRGHATLGDGEGREASSAIDPGKIEVTAGCHVSFAIV